MIVCELCIHYEQGNSCSLDLKIPKTMSCRDFAPEILKFFANPKDFVDLRQLTEMATFFGIKGTELKKIKVMGAQAEKARSSLIELDCSDCRSSQFNS